LLQPALGNSIGDNMQIGMDPGMVCALSKSLAVGFRTSVMISFIGGTLRVALNGAVVCTQSYTGLAIVGPSQNAKVFAGSPWYESAHAEVHEVEYEQAGLDGTLPGCEAVFCEGPLPAVPGARTDIPTGRGCIGQPHGFVCGDITCPNGTVLSTKFVCAGVGTWRGQTGEVRCDEVTCSKHPPTLLGSDPLMYCNARHFEDVCAIRCAPGYANSGALTCAANGSWIPLPGATPSCTPKPCGAAPLVLHGIPGDMERCSQLPSGTTCVIGCSPPFVPLGQYRCHMQMWTEVPICVKRENVQGQANTWIIKAALAAEPSSEVQQRLPYANDWAKNVALAASQVLSKHFSAETGKAISVHVLAYVGSGDATPTGNSRRLQDSSAPAQTWRADVSLIVVPNGTAKADAQALAAGFQALQPAFLEVLLQDALPTHATPDFILTRLSVPQLGQLPPDVAAQLSTVSPLSVSTAETEEETVAITSTTPPEASSNDSNSSQIVNEGDGAADSASVAEEVGDMDEGVPLFDVLILMCAPLAFCMACFMCYKYTKYNMLHSAEALEHEHDDWKKCIDSWQHEDVMTGIDDKMLSDFIAKQAAEQRRAALKSSMSAEKKHEHQQQAALQGETEVDTKAEEARVPHSDNPQHHKTTKQVAQEFKAVAMKTKQGVKAQREEARKHLCVRLTVCLAKTCCPRKKDGVKKAHLSITAVGDGEDDEEEDVELAADHDPYAEGLKEDSSESGGEQTDFEKALDKADQDSQADEEEDKARKDGTYLREGARMVHNDDMQGVEVVAEDKKPRYSEISFQLEEDVNPDTVSAKIMYGIRAIRRFRLAKFADKVVPRLRNSAVTGSAFTFIFDALNIHTPSENLHKVDKGGDADAEAVEAAAEDAEYYESEDDRPAPKVPPSLLWECRHFGGKIVVHSMLFTDEEEHHHGHWIGEDRFACNMPEHTFVARFTELSVHTYFMPGKIDHKACMTCELNEELEAIHEEHEYDHRDFFDFHGCDKLQPVWEHAAAFYDHRMESKLKAAREAHNTGSTHSEVAGNQVRLHKDIKIDYVNLCSIETVTTQFKTPNRKKVHRKGHGVSVVDGKTVQDDKSVDDDFDSEEELEHQDADHEKVEHEHHHHHKDKKEVVDDPGEQAESESAVSKSETNSSSEGSHHGGQAHTSQDQSEEDIKPVEQTAEVLAAVAKARAASLYQDLSEKHRSKAAKEHMGVTEGGEGFFGGLADAFENAVDGDDGTPGPGGTVLGGSMWGWVTGGGPPACGR